MENISYESMQENLRLERTISLAKAHLQKAKQRNVNNKSEIIESKREMRENATHSVSSLWSSEGFETLAALSQYMNPITSKIADYEATENKIALLERLIKSPYFARIDFKFDDDGTSEQVYIGRSSLMDDDSYEMYIYDWRSPIASVFYRFTTGEAFYEAPNGTITGEVGLKRQYEINDGILEYFFDANVQIIDEFLRKLLSQNASSTMKTIVESIQKEQDLVIRDMDNELMMVQGAAGSGKTSVALHRAAYLMYQGLSNKLSANNILIVSPNALFERYISNVLPELGEENIVTAVFEEILGEVLQNKQMQSKNQLLESLLTNHMQRNIMKFSLEFKTSRQFIEIIDRYIADLPENQIKFEDIYFNDTLITSKEQLKSRVISGRKETPLGVKLNQLEHFVLSSAADLVGKGISRLEAFELQNVIRKFTELSTEELYTRLMNDDIYFNSLVSGLVLPECIKEILQFTRKNLAAGVLCYDDATAMALMEMKIKRLNPYKNIKQVVVDEAQDYYPIHFEILNLLFKDAKFTILGDINQTLEKQEDLSFYEQIKAILSKRKASLITMDKSFRCTTEISNYSSKFASGETIIKSFSRNGAQPNVYTASDQASINSMIISEVNACTDEGYRTIGLICKTERNASLLYEELKGKANIQLVKHNSTADLHGVFIIPVYMSKGLEFDAVLICDANSENYHSRDDTKLLYIACTRALHRLNLFSPGEVSLLL